MACAYDRTKMLVGNCALFGYPAKRALAPQLLVWCNATRQATVLVNAWRWTQPDNQRQCGTGRAKASGSVISSRRRSQHVRKAPPGVPKTAAAAAGLTKIAQFCIHASLTPDFFLERFYFLGLSSYYKPVVPRAQAGGMRQRRRHRSWVRLRRCLSRKPS